MKRFFLIIGTLLSIVLTTASCQEELEQTDPNLVFELYEMTSEGEIAVSGVQHIPFGEVKKFKLKSAYLTSIETLSGPAGWDYKFYPGTREAIITAPLASDANAEPSGTIIVRQNSLKGMEATYELQVSVFEGAPELSFVEELDLQTFSYGASREFAIQASASISTLEIEMPEGWRASYELGQESKLILFSPSAIGQGAENGIVRITPVTPSNTKGEPIKLEVEANNTPVIEFNQSECQVSEWGGSLEVGFTCNNVASATIESSPEGWITSLDFQNRTLQIVAPADSSNPEAIGSGEITIKLIGADNLTGTASIRARLLVPGIVSQEDLIAFGEAVASGTPIDSRLLVNGNPTLTMNIDLTKCLEKTYFIGSENGLFDGTFDGNNKRIKIAICLADGQTTGGLFYAVGQRAVIKSLTVEGSILSLSKTTGVTIGAVAAISQGAKFTDITTDVDFAFRPIGGWYNFSKKSSQYGSVTGIVRNAPGEYVGCVSKGEILLDNGAMRSVGGQIGLIEIDGTKLTDCTNQGSIYIDVPDAGAPSNVDNTMYGGLVGNSECWETQYLRCINRGAITIDLHFCRVNSGTTPQIYGVGGIAGVSFGTFTDCINYGKIWGKETAGTATRRYGGILGGSLGTQLSPKPTANDTKNLSIKGCINEGDILHSSPFVGGIAGMIMQGLYAEIVGCVNKGAITNQTTFDSAADRGLQPQALGGVVGQFRGNLVKDCINEGTISGQSRHHVGGIIGFGRPYTKDAARPIEVVNCENKGTINVNSVKGSKTAAEVLQVGGVISIHDGVWKIENCRNSGSITSTSDEVGHVSAIYVNRTGSTILTDEATNMEQAKKDKITDNTHQ